jgi:hypothetical protein
MVKKVLKIIGKVIASVLAFVVIVIAVTGAVCEFIPGKKADYTRVSNPYI